VNAMNIIITIAIQVMEKMSPEIRQAIQGLIADLKVRAEKTVNPWDDILVILLAGIFGKRDS